MSNTLDHPQRLSPHLRMIFNGDDEVNSYRSVLSASVITSQAAINEVEPLKYLKRASEPEPDDGRAPLAESFRRNVRVSCFVQLENHEAVPNHLGQSALQRGNLVTADLTRSQIEALGRGALQQGVAYVETGSPLALLRPTVVQRHIRRPGQRIRTRAERTAFLQAPARTPVLIGIIDVGGFDFAHDDFLDSNGNTRFVRIWDQGAPSDEAPKPFGYGHELTQEAMNRAIEGARQFHVAPSDLLPQTAQTPGAHATHVASVAGGNRGVYPDALLAGVLIALDEEDENRHRTFFDSTRLAHAVDYLLDLSRVLGTKGQPLPVVINISLGTNGHAHDGTSPISRWIDTALATPGRCVCVAAGNAGQESPQFEGDLGFTSGRIHASGTVSARGLDFDLDWEVVGNGFVDVSENKLEIWYEAGDEFAVSVRSPSGEWCKQVGPGQFYENREICGPTQPVPRMTYLSVYNERFHPANGANRISVFLSPQLKGQAVGIESGTWTVRLHGVEVRDGRFDVWIERDDPRPMGRIGTSQAWRFPSYFSKRSHVDRSSVSSLACGRDVIAVGNSDEPNERINVSSSQGPTRDGRYKPDIAAPGTDIVAARGFAGNDRRHRWIKMTGTSMASPFVAGVAARMLAVQPHLTSTQIMGIMRRSAQPLPGSDFQWRDDAGFGQLRPGDCLRQVNVPFQSDDLDHAQRDHVEPDNQEDGS